MRKKKTLLAPGIKKLRNLRQQMAEMEQEYTVKKKDYDNFVNAMEQEKEQIVKDMGSNF